jgi:hypothetical protein
MPVTRQTLGQKTRLPAYQSESAFLTGGAGDFLAVMVGAGTDVAISQNLTSWSKKSGVLPNLTWFDACVLPTGRIIVVNSSLDATCVSAYSDNNGASFTKVTSANMPLHQWHRVKYSPTLNRVVASGSGGNFCYSDDHGVTWTDANAGARAITYDAFAWLGGSVNLFIGSSNAGVFDQNGALSSPDGQNWTVRTSNDGGWGHTHTDYFIVAGNAAYAWGDDSQTINRTADGITYTGGLLVAPAGGVSGLGGVGTKWRLGATTQNMVFKKTAADPAAAGVFVLTDLGFNVNGGNVKYVAALRKWIAWKATTFTTSSDGDSWTAPAAHGLTNASRYMGMKYDGQISATA